MAYANISSTVQIGRSVTKLIALVGGAILFVLVGVWLITGDFSHTRRGFLAVPTGWLSIVFFGLCAILGMQRLIFGPKYPVTLSSDGLVDLRLSRTLVPWRSISDIQTLTIARTSMLGLVINKGLKLETSPFMRFWITLNKRFYKSDYWLASTDLDLNFERLRDLVLAYWKAHGSDRTMTGDPAVTVKGVVG